MTGIIAHIRELELDTQAREILGVDAGCDKLVEDRALYKKLAEVGLQDFDTDADRTNALYQVFKAHDDLECVRKEEQFPGALDRMGETVQTQRESLLARADKLSRALSTEHGRYVMDDIRKQVEEIERLEDLSTMQPSMLERFAQARGVTLPKQVSRFLNQRARPGESVGRLMRTEGMFDQINTQMTGLMERGAEMLKAQGWQPPEDTLG